MPALRKRIEGFANQSLIASGLARFDAAVSALTDTLANEAKAVEASDKAFQSEQDARREIREQLESAYGRLRDFYKSKPTLAEGFFLKEGRRKAPKNPAPDAASPPPT